VTKRLRPAAMRIGFYSAMGGLPWGGSEELWSRTAAELLRQGHKVAFNCRKWPAVPPPLQRLIDSGATARFRSGQRLGRSIRRPLERLGLLNLAHIGWLRKTKPDLLVISFACHTDDPQIAAACQLLGIRYAIVLQAAGADNWIPPRSVATFRAAYENASQCFFVSHENRELVESNLAADLSGTEIVDNPFTVPVDAAPAWPSPVPFWKLACVARIHFPSKGQDLLLRVLRAPKWRARPLKISLWGEDNGYLGQVHRLIEQFQVGEQIHYAGVHKDMTGLWEDHHGLLLPSRVEGNPLALIEAMICGRMSIVTNVGRSAELVDHNVSGFIAPAATAELIDVALEQAWQNRREWQAMGKRAAVAIRERHSLTPAQDFARRILDLASATRKGGAVVRRAA
jgi:glycosyltransferase involved in cell wall biosynthesis